MASGDTLIFIDPRDNEWLGANPATPDTRNNHPLLDFSDTTDEKAVFKCIMPRNYAGGGITVYIHYAMTSDVTNKVRWEAAFERVGDGQQDIDSDGFAAAQAVNVAAVPATSGHVDIVAITFTNGAQMDSVAVGEGFRLQVERKPSDGANDTATGDAELWAIEIKET